MTEDQTISNEAIAPNAKRLLWAGFMAILAAGVGFAIRGGIFDNWGKEFGFTGAQLGSIGGAGLSGFCFGIIIGGVICDKIGYGKLVITAFLLHILSAVVTFAAVPGDGGEAAKSLAYNCLFGGMFIFAFANGTLEAVANPLVATLFPHNRTHYLNILHASWPAGMIIGVALGWVLDDKMEMSWKIQLSLYLIPTLAYGIMFFGQSFPKSEASEKGASLGEMFKDVGILGALVVAPLLLLFCGSFLPLFGISGDVAEKIGYVVGGLTVVAVGILTKGSIGSFLLFTLFITHALIGSVELGTDQWIQFITGNIFTSSEQGKYLFLWTSVIMFSLRFCANWIEQTLKFTPVMLLFVCSVLAFIGLQLASSMTSIEMAFVALGIYAVGKTFFWPTMLAVASDRFPQTGAVAISIMGGIGMLSVGTIGGPGLGYLKDRYAGESLKEKDAALFAEYKAEKPSTFLSIKSMEAFGLDGKKLGEAKDAKEKTEKQKAVVAADQLGDRKTLKLDSYIPATMALLYLGIFLYFKSIGGYKAVHLEGTSGEGHAPKA
ncbi:MAG: major facilitator superfamily protein [Limisphaerales bacterium]|nr:MAG: major facilitator superfamily protein [Limisphaerales bacterium]KAG0508318.1 MAG: major facilitator superfamily protein [Limisphaerales bacterium]TXT49633.1 MAG: major facilitator superfamily protein [Limisphaerales bacterium]